MQNANAPVRIDIKNGWGICPVCGNPKFLKVNPDTTAHDLPKICKRCRRESIVNIEAPEPATTASSA